MGFKPTLTEIRLLRARLGDIAKFRFGGEAKWPGWRETSRGAANEKDHLIRSCRRRVGDAGPGSRYESHGTGSAAGAAEPVGRRLWRRHHLGLHLPRHHPIQSQAVG